eukprot:SAG31_NODE_1524_length_8006_cov_11.768812_7_plen_124_part_00
MRHRHTHAYRGEGSHAVAVSTAAVAKTPASFNCEEPGDKSRSCFTYAAPSLARLQTQLSEPVSARPLAFFRLAFGLLSALATGAMLMLTDEVEAKFGFVSILQLMIMRSWCAHRISDRIFHML